MIEPSPSSSVYRATSKVSRGFSLRRKKSKKEPMAILRTQSVKLATLPGVGGLELKSPLPDHLLPPEVLLLEPTAAEIRDPQTQIRMLFVNTPLDDDEQA